MGPFRGAQDPAGVQEGWAPPSPAPPSLTLGVPWGPDLGAGVQEHTGPDAIPTVTFAAAAGDLVTDPSQRGCGTEARSSEGLV